MKNRQAFIYLLILYVLISAPIVCVFTANEYVRFIMYETVANWISKIRPPDYAFCGDSITAGAREFELKLSGLPFSGINYGQSGYTLKQIKGEVVKSLEKKARVVFITGGVNDFFNGFDVVSAVNNYEEMLILFNKTESKCVITSTPLTTNDAVNKKIKSLNEFLVEYCKNKNIKYIDLNSGIAQNGTLGNEFTIDGVHLSKAAYKIWARKIME